VTQLLTDHNTQGGPKYQYKYTQTHNDTQTQSLIEITTQRFVVISISGRDYWEDLGVDGRIILQRILEKYGKTCGVNVCVSG
jgi:hypothetical protein